MSHICPPIYQKYLPAFLPRTNPSPTGERVHKTQQKVFKNPNQKSFQSSSDFDAQVFWFNHLTNSISRAEPISTRSDSADQFET